MKKYIIAFAALAIVLSCAKENPVQDEPVNEETKGTVVTFTATIPELTRASVDDTSFGWEDGDQIAIPATGIDGGYAIFTTHDKDHDGTLGTFTCTLGAGQSLIAGTAKYPATTPGNSFDSPTAAKKAFQMEASYKLGDKSLSFTHKSALVHLSFSNVPPFATSVVVKAGASTVATIALSSPSASVIVDVPMTPSDVSTKYSFALMEGSNTIREVSKTTTLSAGTYYGTPSIAINKYIILLNADKDATYRLGLQARTGDSYIGYSGDYDTDYDMVSYNKGASRYMILPDDFSSAKAIKVVLRKDGDDCTSATERIFLDRNPSFDVSEDSMKTSYRVYYGGSLKTKVYQYYQPLLYLKDEIWKGNVLLHYWYTEDDVTDDIGTYCYNDYCGKFKTDGDYAVFKVKPSLAGKTVNVKVINPNNKDYDWFQTTMTLYTGKTYGGVYWNSGGNGYYPISGSFNFDHTDSEWPGDAPSVGSTTNLPYIEFDQSLYGNSQINVIFNNGNSGYGNQSSTWSGTLNEDGYFAS